MCKHHTNVRGNPTEVETCVNPSLRVGDPVAQEKNDYDIWCKKARQLHNPKTNLEPKRACLRVWDKCSKKKMLVAYFSIKYDPVYKLAKYSIEHLSCLRFMFNN